MFRDYDIIVVGAGHAGCEAAAAAAKLGSTVMLITMNMQTIAQMSCNPAMGGIAKGQIIREIDALGGGSAIITDKTMLQFRMLNRSKGPAMWSPRAQNDRMLFAHEWRMCLEANPNIDFWQDMVMELIVEKGRAVGVKTGMGMEIRGKAVVLTNGTFLNGIIHIGEKKFGGGRMAEKAASGITEQLISLGFESGRMKTGTPPRVDGRTLDYSRMEVQHGDNPPGKFSFTDTSPLKTQLPCHIAYTNKEVHDILRTGFDKSPMFTGRIQGRGPRYCPSIEDKIERFSERERHQLFIEPEGWRTIEVYVNGFSSSLPEEVQYRALKKIPGFENVKMFRPGYAIEYDWFPPTQLELSLETKLVKNLFFAGQINGTTGYEEAACQGLMAGINAHRIINNLEPIVLKRSEAYIGVLIDDLINKGTNEPYRMFTSRAEYRILLRQDNADIRLTPLGFQTGLADEDRLKRMNRKKQGADEIIEHFRKEPVSPDIVNGLLDAHDTAPLQQSTRLYNLLKRPQLDIAKLKAGIPELSEFLDNYSQEQIELAEIEMKYDGYIQKEKELVEKMVKLEEVPIIEGFDYSRLKSLSNEAREKLSKVRPHTLGQASRVSGVSPADISVLMVYMGR
ncbi:MAG TPA: tRNA uridine-5-carboxymethylaminomethyl(34) synthesis enzyme MnmG [Chitinophagales bacterium]|nr:tRNA uridine-5-carboxymethylaminomethyl(34) synthesis enzyme MnmG [Chitinophagales bacterium]